MINIRALKFLAMLGSLLLGGCATQALDRSSWVFLENAPASQEILMSVALGDEERAIDLIEDGAPLNVFTPQGTLLHLASEKRMDRLVLRLLDLGANPNFKHGTDVPAIHLYAGTRQTEVIKAFVRAGTDLEARDAEGRTALAVAIDAGSLQSTRLLILAGANVDAMIEEESLLARTAKDDRYLLFTQMLLDAGADPFGGDDQGKLLYAIATEQARLVLPPERGPELWLTDITGLTLEPHTTSLY